ncbi:hypothetical protein N657DRAFT_629218 [Parathielavia appendiculata]|uniref:Uncharacterized protein n=1 Tax=Parathielavia appendiculata TaxID=2587402 RepID=A0AAN6Z812_9PEZI|nr:hypothetical protein N657DRAFT_629218 [Parathielavia appendiculata]
MPVPAAENPMLKVLMVQLSSPSTPESSWTTIPEANSQTDGDSNAALKPKKAASAPAKGDAPKLSPIWVVPDPKRLDDPQAHNREGSASAPPISCDQFKVSGKQDSDRGARVVVEVEEEEDADRHMALLELLERDYPSLTRFDEGHGTRCGDALNCITLPCVNVNHQVAVCPPRYPRQSKPYKDVNRSAHKVLIVYRSRIVRNSFILRRQLFVVRKPPNRQSANPTALDMATLAHIVRDFISDLYWMNRFSSDTVQCVRAASSGRSWCLDTSLLVDPGRDYGRDIRRKNGSRAGDAYKAFEGSVQGTRYVPKLPQAVVRQFVPPRHSTFERVVPRFLDRNAGLPEVVGISRFDWNWKALRVSGYAFRDSPWYLGWVTWPTIKV